MFTFKAKISSGSKTVATWTFILPNNILNNVWSTQSYLMIGILSIFKNWSHANANFFRVQDCLKIHPCFSCDVVFMSNVQLACCKPIVALVGVKYHVDFF
jgi:hypothetical protein